MTEIVLVYVFRIFWALFLSALFAGSFYEVWRMENGKQERMYRKKSDTVIWLDPMLFPIYVFLFMGVGFFVYLKTGECTVLMVSAVDLLLFISFYYTFLLLLLPILRKYFAARTCATFWVIPVFLFYQPYIIYSSMTLSPFIYLYIPQNILMALIYIWFAGFLLIFGFQVVSHLRFTQNLKRNSRPAEDPELLEVLNGIRNEINYSLPVELRYCSVLRSPLSVGMKKKNKITYLPEKSFTEKEMKLILSHELHHIQRADTHTKFFLRFCIALGWFHPIVWIAVKRGEEDLELSCDEIVLKGADNTVKKQYAKLLLTIAEDSRGFSTCLSASAKTLKYRLKATVSEKKKRSGTILLFAAMFLSSLIVGRTALVIERGSAGEITGIAMDQITEANLSFPNTGENVPLTDTDALASYLSNLAVERDITVYEYAGDAEPGKISLAGKFKEDMYFLLTENYLQIYGGENFEGGVFHLCESADWEYIRMLE